VVYPAASLPLVAKDNGAKLIIINREPTPLDSLADEVINGELKEIMQALDHQQKN
jgi:NAD-dependent deacetylase